MRFRTSETKGAVFLPALAGILMLAGAFVAGAYVGVTNRPAIEEVVGVRNKEEMRPKTVDFEPFWRAWNTINEKYVSGNGADDQKKVYGAIKGLTGSLDDPYSVFLDPEEYKLFQETLTGNFGGVGMEIGMRNDTLTVIAPLKGTPAERVGIRTGDKVVEIDGTPTSGMSLERAVTLIRGERGTSVKLVVVREGEKKPLEFTIVRDVIEIPTIETESKPGSAAATPGEGGDRIGELTSGVFIVRLFNFTATSPDLFRRALREFIALGTTSKFILDLRGNPGGFLDAAVEVASYFLPAGKVVVKEELSGGAPGRVHRSQGYDVFHGNLRMVILVNNGSASASEIVAGALQEHGIATIVGEKTFGKGSVQELIGITEETALKLTIARWLTPGGVSISESGITPDLVVEITEEDIEAKRDPQLDKAVEILNAM